MQSEVILENEMVKKEILDHLDIRSLRKQAGFSQEDLAKSLGISQSTLSRFERAPQTIELQYYLGILSLCIPSFSVLGLAALGLMSVKDCTATKLLHLLNRHEKK